MDYHFICTGITIFFKKELTSKCCCGYGGIRILNNLQVSNATHLGDPSESQIQTPNSRQRGVDQAQEMHCTVIFINN